MPAVIALVYLIISTNPTSCSSISVVGGNNQVEAVLNYIRILSKLRNANLKITPKKSHIFPSSVDVLGWVWKCGGFLSLTPYRLCALINVKQEDIKVVGDMRR